MKTNNIVKWAHWRTDILALAIERDTGLSLRPEGV
jgi:hypothetical protein